LGPALLGVALTGATGVCLYLLLKNDDEEDYSHVSKGKTSRQVALDVRIPKESVGIVIGRQGSNIREIQSKTETRINFKDEMETDTHRVACIRGLPDDAQMAEILIHQTIANQPRLETLELLVPIRAVGRIIGRNGDTIRSLQMNAGCKIEVERGGEEDPDGKKKITIKGTSHQIELAKAMVIEKVAEEEELRQKLLDTQVNRPPRLKCTEQLFLKSEGENVEKEVSMKGEQEELKPTSTDQCMEVFVSAISTPGAFWVQKIGPISVDLDKLTQNMTMYYDNPSNQSYHILTKVEPGDIVVAKFSGDSSYFRARVVAFKLDEYDESKSKVDLDFVDFGDAEEKEISEIFGIRTDYLRLRFQAIQCALVGFNASKLKPIEGTEWGHEVVDEFERLTHCAQWKSVWAKISNSSGSGPPQVQLIDCNHTGGDLNIGDELVKRGLAAYEETEEKFADADQPEINWQEMSS